MGLVIKIDELLHALGWSLRDAAKHLGIDERLLSRLGHDSWPSIKRTDLNTLLRLVQAAARQLGAPSVRTLEQDTPLGEIERLLDHCNCIFVGSSKFNWKADFAYRRMLDLHNIPPERARSALPVLFAFAEVDWNLADRDPARASAFAEAQTEKCGLLVQTVRALTPLRVTYHKTIDDFLRGAGNGRDAGVVIARRWMAAEHDKPLTTILLSGFSGLATRQLGEALMNDTIPIDDDALADGAVAVRILRFAFRKEAGTPIRKPLRQRPEWFRPDVQESVWNDDGLPLSLKPGIRSRKRRK